MHDKMDWYVKARTQRT